MTEEQMEQFEGVDWGRQRLVEAHAFDDDEGIVALTSDGEGELFAYLIVVADLDASLVMRLEPETAAEEWATLKRMALEDA